MQQEEAVYATRVPILQQGTESKRTRLPGARPRTPAEGASESVARRTEAAEGLTASGRLRRAILLALPILCISSGQAFAQCKSDELTMITKPSGKTFDAFGRAVAMDGDLAVVTADGEDNMGAAYAYQNDAGSWSLIQHVVPADHESLDLFGRTAVLQGTTMIIGNPWDDDAALNSGSAVAFEFDGSQWAEVQELTPSDGVEFGQFGWSMAIDGDTLVIGAIGDEEIGANDTGAVYVFHHDGASWVQEHKLTVSSADDLDQFGFQVAIQGDQIVATALQDDDAGLDAGAAYVFGFDGANWVEQQKLVGSDTAAIDWFGWSVALQGDLLAIGAINHDIPAENGGAVYLFELNGGVWSEMEKITPAKIQAFESFGWSADLEGDRLIVGAVGADTFGGGLYLFQDVGAQWVQSYLWTGSGAPGTGFFDDNLGMSVDLDAGRVLGGAPFADGEQSDAGAVYVYEVTDLAIDAIPDAAQAGDEITVRACGGAPGEDVRLFRHSLTGNPTQVPLASGTFGGAGVFQTKVTIPPSAAGKQIGFSAHGFWQPGVPGTSSIVGVDVDP